VYYELGHGIRIDWLIEAIEALRVEGRWQALARGTLRAGAHEVQRRLFEEALANGEPGDPPGDRLRAWLEARAAAVGRAQRSMTEIQVSGTRDFATLSVALEELRRLLPAP
jgi:glutamate dehydrogenase